MFVVARIMIGYGNAASTIAAPTYVAETLPYKWRGWGLALITDFYYVGENYKIYNMFGTDVVSAHRWLDRSRHYFWHG